MALLSTLERKVDNNTPTALSTDTDENCLYNAASLLLIGDQSLAHLLRAMVSIELFLHKNYYKDHPFIADKQKAISKKNVFSKCLRHSSTTDLENTDTSHLMCVTHESIANCETKKWSSMMCMLALSTVMKCPIRSIYPKTSTIF